MRTAVFSFTKTEEKQLLRSTLLLGVILFLFAWRTTDLGFFQGILYLTGYILLCGAALYVFAGSAKHLAHNKGYHARYDRWHPAQVFALIVSVLSTGLVPLLFAGAMYLEANPRMTHGRIFPGENKKDIMAVGWGSILAVILFAALLRALHNILNIAFTYYAAVGVAIIALLLLLPLPNTQGGQLFFVSKKSYTLTAFVLALLCVMIITNTIIYTLLAVIIIAIMVFFIKRARKVKKN